MAGQRAKDKVQIGAYIDVYTYAGIESWLSKNKRKTKTDFLVEAILHKLETENIPLPPEAGSRQLPSRSSRSKDTGHYVLNDGAASSKPVSEAAELLDAAADEAANPSPSRKPKR